MGKLKTIREVAREYYVRYSFIGNDRAFAERHFEEGAAWMQVELTRWRDTRVELPVDDEVVLVRWLADREGLCTGHYDTTTDRWELNDVYLSHLSSRVKVHILSWLPLPINS